MLWPANLLEPGSHLPAAVTHLSTYSPSHPAQYNAHTSHAPACVQLARSMAAACACLSQRVQEFCTACGTGWMCQTWASCCLLATLLELSGGSPARWMRYLLTDTHLSESWLVGESVGRRGLLALSLMCGLGWLRAGGPESSGGGCAPASKRGPAGSLGRRRHVCAAPDEREVRGFGGLAALTARCSGWCATRAQHPCQALCLGLIWPRSSECSSCRGRAEYTPAPAHRSLRRPDPQEMPCLGQLPQRG